MDVHPLAVVALAAVAMEPVAAIAHRWLMHRRGWRWHASHHRSSRGARLAATTSFEVNDLFPLSFAALTIAAMALGTAHDGLRAAVWIGAGVTAYGAAYLLVHDVCIHGRLGRQIEGGRYLRWVREAHREHHRTGRAPYGFLVPVVRRGREPETTAAAAVSTLRDVDTRTRPEKTS